MDVLAQNQVNPNITMPPYLNDEEYLNNSGNVSVSPTAPPWQPLPEWQQWLWYTVFALIVFAAVVLNFMVLCIVLCERRMRKNVTNHPLVSLAAADLLTSLLNTPWNLYIMMNNDWIWSDGFCKLNQFFSNVFIAASVFTPWATSVDRYIGLVADPTRQNSSKENMKLVIGAIWMISLFLSIPNLIWFKKLPVQDSNRSLCIWVPTYTYQYYNIGFLVMTYILPIVSMVVCYSRVAKTLQKSKGISGPREDRKRLIKMLMMVVAFFAICWLPFHIYFLVEGLWPSLREKAYAQPTFFCCYWLAMFNSTANPIVYYKYLPTFRKSFRKVFCFFRGDNSSSRLSSSTRHNRSNTLTTCISMDTSGSEPQRNNTTPSVRNKVAWFKGQESVQVY